MQSDNLRISSIIALGNKMQLSKINAEQVVSCYVEVTGLIWVTSLSKE